MSGGEQTPLLSHPCSTSFRESTHQGERHATKRRAESEARGGCGGTALVWKRRTTLRQYIVSLAATREAFSSISQPPLSGSPHHGVTMVEVRDKSVSPAPSASSTIPPVVRASEAASRVNESE